MTIYYEGQCCVDCVQYLANGDIPEERPHLEEEIAAQWPDTALHLVNNDTYGEDGDVEYDEFSRAECDCCGSTLAGSRYGFAVLQP